MSTANLSLLIAFAYDNLGQRTSLIRGNGTVTTYSYDSVSRLQQLSQDLAGTARDQVLDFAYNPAGQIASTIRSNDAYAWTGAMGFSETMLLREAGRAQIGDGTSRPEWGTPGHPIWGGGKPPCGDDPVDQGHIKDGISDAENDC